MASSTFNLSSSSLCAASWLPLNQNPLHSSLPKPNLGLHFSSLSPSFQRLSLSSITPLRTTFQLVPKLSESASTSVIESDEGTVEFEPDSPVSSPSPVVESTATTPKREEIFAVVMVGSRQYIVIPGRWIVTQRLKGANVNDKIVLNKVLLVGTKNSTYVGKPIVTNAVVHAVVEEQTLDKKVIVFKYKKKKNYRRNIGHRQPITRIKITGITGYEDYPASTLDS